MNTARVHYSLKLDWNPKTKEIKIYFNSMKLDSRMDNLIKYTHEN